MRFTRQNTFSFILSLVFLCLSSTVQSANRFGGFSTESGLAGQLVRDIAQDQQGFIWFATAYGLSRYDGYSFKNFYHEESNENSLSSNNLWKLHVDHQGTLWIITERGLDKYTGSGFVRHSIQNSRLGSGLSSDSGSDSGSVLRAGINGITSTTDGLWVGTDSGVVYFTYNDNAVNGHSVSFLYGQKTQDLISTSSDEIIVANRNGLYRMRSGDSKFKRWEFSSAESLNDIRKLYLDQKNNLWAASQDSLYEVKVNQNTYQKKYENISKNVVESIVFDQENTWIGTRRNGLYKIDLHGNDENYQYESQLRHSISDNVIAALFIDSERTLWVGTFNSGVNYQNKNVGSFGLYQSGSGSLSCLTSQSVNYLKQANSNEWLVGTNTGIYRIKPGAFCKKINFFQTTEAEASPIVYSAYEMLGDLILIGHSKGLTLYDIRNDTAKKIFPEHINRSVYFIKPYKNDLLLGTHFNIYRYDTKNETLQIFDTPKSSNNQSIGASQVNFLGDKMLFSTVAGLLVFDSDNNFIPFASGGHRALSSPVSTMVVDEKYLWIGNDNDHHLFQFNYEGQLIDKYPLSTTASNIRPLSLQSAEKHLWISSTHGLFRLNKETKALKQYLEVDGLQSNVFIRNSSSRSSDGKLFFGGKNGFNAFYPSDIKENITPPRVVLTELRRFNKPVKHRSQSHFSGDFSISQPIERLKTLELSYRDYVMSIEFAGLHSTDPKRNRYAYKLENLHQNWIYTDASNRVATFTNLDSGHYVFRVRAANKDDKWSLVENEVSLDIVVHPAPWLTWWAYTLYLLFIMAGVLFFIRVRTRSAVRRANELSLEVHERTKEIQTKKRLIESLLERKNEQFANISHEFRTPLTLILGPLEKELEALDNPKNPKHLKMIERNAIRLLGMVEQILKLTELKKDEQVKKFSYSLNPLLVAIIETFQPLAESKRITLSVDLDTCCNILAADDAIEVMVGNLISNAIKYSLQGGCVCVKTKRLDEQVHILVSDSGVGMSESQQKVVFERFVRLDQTSDIAGTGIGLSIVNELVHSHGGRIDIESCKGKGSCFTLFLPTTQMTATNRKVTLQSISHLTYQEDFKIHSIEENNTREKEKEISSAKDSLLIIEDNTDMQEYLNSILSGQYICFSALRGEAGIETAVAQIPDLIICDVMMPGINGYEVTRRLRDDERTSHIPIILLTAKGDKKSRIQGWDENIDGYMTKPFDEQELLVRIRNILSIRNILRQKAFQQFFSESGNAAHSSISQDGDSFEVKNGLEIKNSGLNEKEQAFVDKLMQVIEDNYSEASFQRVHLASQMAVSERQLHRKVQALLNQNPIEMLREYRLKIAIEKLKKGLQVGLVSEQCGFSSPSYFSQCFKARFGSSPKDLIRR